jgi:serine/threonine protein kinase
MTEEVIINNYRILKEIGKGRYGIVYQVENVENKKM